MARPPLAAARQPRRPRVRCARRSPERIGGAGAERINVLLRGGRVALPRARHAGAGRGGRAASAPSRSTGCGSSSTSTGRGRPSSSCTTRRSSSAWRGSTGSGSRTTSCCRRCSRDDAAHPARLLRPRPPRVVAPGRQRRGGDDAVDRAPVQPCQRRGAVRDRAARAIASSSSTATGTRRRSCGCPRPGTPSPQSQRVTARDAACRARDRGRPGDRARDRARARGGRLPVSSRPRAPVDELDSRRRRRSRRPEARSAAIACDLTDRSQSATLVDRAAAMLRPDRHPRQQRRHRLERRPARRSPTSGTSSGTRRSSST